MFGITKKSKSRKYGNCRTIGNREMPPNHQFNMDEFEIKLIHENPCYRAGPPDYKHKGKPYAISGTCGEDK